MKDLIKQFNLYGKITEQYAKDIEEILENYKRRVRKETAEATEKETLKNLILEYNDAELEAKCIFIY